MAGWLQKAVADIQEYEDDLILRFASRSDRGVLGTLPDHSLCVLALFDGEDELEVLKKHGVRPLARGRTDELHEELVRLREVLEVMES